MTSKRPLSGSGSLTGDSASVSSPPSHQLKKIKVGETSSQDSPTMIITDPVHGDLRTAININKALRLIDRNAISRIGYCPSKIQQFGEPFGLYQTVTSEDEMKLDEQEGLESVISNRDLANQAILDELETVYEDMESLSVSHATGECDTFSLRITRPGCEYDKRVVRYSSNIKDLLTTWFEHSSISGYGDMNALETKIDPQVRNAREIPASEFHVEQRFLDEIQKHWAKRFLPRDVRAEPYKIHLYGPGGHFNSHRDTPETGLVGTFLVGLGDTSTTPGGNFHIADKTLEANPLTWVAFHPDVPHKITKVEGGYRAVIAFKIFRVNGDEDEVVPAQLEARVKKILDQIPLPFGLLTTHQYSMGTTCLNGIDTLLSAYARSKTDARTHMLPVVTNFYGEAFYEYVDPDTYENVAESDVYPFTAAHVDILLGKNVSQAREQVKWLEGSKDIPFYSWDMGASSEVWKEDHPEGSNNTGNEADSYRESSVYLSYAILFLPQQKD